MGSVKEMIGKLPISWSIRILKISVGQFFGQLLSFIFLIMVSWFYTENEYGQIRYIINLGTFFGIVACSGIPQFFARIIPIYKKDRLMLNNYFSNSIILSIVFVIILSLIIFGMVNNILVIFIMISYCYMMIYYGIIQGFLYYNRVATYMFIINIFRISLFLLIFFFINYFDWNMPLVVYFVSPILVIIIFSYVYPFKFKFSFKSSNSLSIKKIFLFSNYILISQVLVMAVMTINLVLLEHKSATFDIAIVTIANTLITPFTLSILGVVNIILPKFAERCDYCYHRKILYFSILFSIIMSSILIIIYFIFGRFIINLMFMGKYSEVYIPMLIQGIGAIFMCIRIIFASYYQGIGRPSILTIDAILGFSVSIIFSLYFLDKLNAIIVSLSILISNVLMFIIDLGFWIKSKSFYSAVSNTTSL